MASLHRQLRALPGAFLADTGTSARRFDEDSTANGIAWPLTVSPGA